MCDTTLNVDIAVDIIDTSLLRRSERRERSETRQNITDDDVRISMDMQCKYCFLFSRKDEHMKIIFKSWNKKFQNEYALKNHQRSKYCAKNEKSIEHWQREEALFDGESNLTDSLAGFNQDISTSCNSHNEDARTPFGILDECDNENIEDYNIDELQDVMVNLEEVDIFHTRFRLNIANPVRNSLRSPATSVFLNDIIQEEIEDANNREENHIDNSNMSRYLQFQRELYSITFGVQSLKSRDFREMVNIIRTTYRHKFKAGFLQNVALYDYWTKHRVSRSQRQEMIDLIRHVFLPNAKPDHIRKSVNGVKYKIEKCLRTYVMHPLQIKWPLGWKVDTMKGMELSPIMIYMRDPMEVIAELLVNPKVMFKYRDHVKFDYFRNDANAYCDLMSSEWCRLTESYIRETKSVEGKVLPIIFYLDGVQLNDNIHNKVTPVMCTIGNFSDELINQDISKCVIGYLPDTLESKEAIFTHLRELYPNTSSTELEKQIRQFDLLIEREFWKEIVKGLRRSYESGVKLYVLGQGIKLFYPCIAFFASDEPQQRRTSGMQTGNCTYSCIYCTYSYKDGIYNPSLHKLRDYQLIKRRSCLAELATYKLSTHQNLSRDEKLVLDEFREQNIQPFINPFFYAPMGINNNILLATPPDTLHCFCAGLMKSLVKTVISIIFTLSSKDDGKNKASFKSSKGVFDRRISTFGYVHDMPHVHWTIFKAGIIRYVNKSIQEKGRSGGSFGGFRSTSFISLLIQIYYSIGFDGSVLPIGRIQFTNNKKCINLNDMQNKVLRAIYSVLDVYFDVKRKEWNEQDLLHFKSKLSNLYVHYMLVWDLNQVMLTADVNHVGLNKQRNPHKIFHLPELFRYYGSADKMDTGTWEKIHQAATTQIYRSTSRRHSTLSYDMLDKYNLMHYSKILGLLRRIHNEGESIIDEFETKKFTETVTYHTMRKFRRIPFRLLFSRGKAELYLDYPWRNVSVHEPIHTSDGFVNIVDKCNLVERVNDYYNINWVNDMYKYNTFIVGAIKFVSDPKSIGEGKLYATTRYNLNAKGSMTNKPRYDYALITATVGDDETVSVLVKLLLIIGIEMRSKYHENTAQGEEEDSPKMELICLVQELILDPNNRVANSLQLGSKYMWAANPSNPNEFKYQFVPVETILRPVMVIPEYSKGKLIDINRPKRSDRFYMIDRKFFDRSGWPVNNLANANDFIVEEKQADYLRENYERKGVNVNHLHQNNTVNNGEEMTLMIDEDDDESEM